MYASFQVGIGGVSMFMTGHWFNSDEILFISMILKSKERYLKCGLYRFNRGCILVLVSVTDARRLTVV